MELINKLALDYPQLHFKSGDTFSWHPNKNLINFIADEIDSLQGQLQMLHETAHSTLNHQNYSLDIDLLQLEVAAWQVSKQLSKGYSVDFNSNYADSCLDTYRDWLHQRSTCINCGFISLQIESGLYKCFNCDSSWRVPHTPICRRIAAT